MIFYNLTHENYFLKGRLDIKIIFIYLLWPTLQSYVPARNQCCHRKFIWGMRPIASLWLNNKNSPNKPEKFVYFIFWKIVLRQCQRPSGNDPKSSLPERRAPSAACRAPRNFEQAVFPENFSWLFFEKSFENWKTNANLFA